MYAVLQSYEIVFDVNLSNICYLPYSNPHILFIAGKSSYSDCCTVPLSL